jgi:hypothetical protein
VEASAEIYASGFTEQEIAEMDHFYSTPTGQSVIAKLPAMTRQILPIVAAEMPAMMKRGFDRLCKKTTRTPEQREIYRKIRTGLKTQLTAERRPS